MKKIIFFFSLLLSSVAFAQNVDFTEENFPGKEGFKEAKGRLEEGDKQFEKGQMFFK